MVLLDILSGRYCSVRAWGSYAGSPYLPHSPKLSLTATARSCSEPRYRSVV